MFARRFLLSPVLILALPGCDALPLNSGAVRWNSGRPPIYMELDGDDALDVIGWVRVQRAGNLSPRVAAFAGKSGRQLWISPMLSTVAEEHLAQFGFAGGRIIVVDPGGRAQAFVPNVETPEWSVDLGERAVEICDGGPALVVVVTKDGKAGTLAVADGAGGTVVPPAVLHSYRRGCASGDPRPLGCGRALAGRAGPAPDSPTGAPHPRHGL